MFFQKMIACVSFIALAIAQANAANWEFVSADVSDSDYYIDRDSIRSSGGFLYIWAKIDASRNNTVKWNVQLDHLKIHCQSRQNAKARADQIRQSRECNGKPRTIRLLRIDGHDISGPGKHKRSSPSLRLRMSLLELVAPIVVIGKLMAPPRLTRDELGQSQRCIVVVCDIAE